MTQTVNFSPSSINIGVTEPGATNTGTSQCAPIAAAASVTASITNDTSGGAFTILSVASYIPQLMVGQLPEPPGPSGGGIGYYFKKANIDSQARHAEMLSGPIWIPLGLYWGARLINQSNGITPLPVAAGEFVQVTVQFAPGDSTPDVCTATLQINGDTWNPVAIPITATVGELRVSVPPIDVNVGASTSVEIGVTLVRGNATTATLILASDASPEAANVTASLSSTLLGPISEGHTASTTLSVSASSNLARGTYIWYLSVWAFNNTYSFSVPVPINVGGYLQSQLYWTQADAFGLAKAYGVVDPRTGQLATEAVWMDPSSPWGAGRLTDAVVTQTAGGFPVNTILVVSDAGVWQVTAQGDATVIGDFSPSSFTSILEVAGTVFIAGGTGLSGGGNAQVYAYMSSPFSRGNWQWVQLAPPGGMSGIQDMCVTPSGQLLFATNNGVWTATSVRVSLLEWRWVFVQATGPAVGFTTIAAFPETGFPQLAVAADTQGNVHHVAVHADGTATLTPILANDKFLNPPAFTAYVTIDAADKTTIYASQVFSNPNLNNNADVGALAKSTDAGQTWTNLGRPGVGMSRGCRVGAYGNVIVAGGERWHISLDFGATWNRYSDLDSAQAMWGIPHAHDDVNAIRFYPVNGQMQLLMCTDGGLATTPTSSGATTWTSGYNKRLRNLQVQTRYVYGEGGGFTGCMSVDNYSSGPTNRGYLVAAGTQDNAVLTCLMPPSGLGFWTHILGGDGLFCAYIPASGVQLPPSVPTREPGGVAPLLATALGSTTPSWFIDGGANGPASPGQDLPYDPAGLPLSPANAQVIGLVLDGITSPQRWFSDSPRVAYGVAGGLLQDNANKPTQYGHFAFIVSGDPDGTNLMMTPLASIPGNGAVTAIFSYDATQLFVCMGDGGVWQLGAGLPRALYPPGEALQETTVPTSFGLGKNFLAKFAMTADGTLYMCASDIGENGYLLQRDPATRQWSGDISGGLFTSSGITSICADNSDPGVLYVATTTTVWAFDGTQWYQAGGGLPAWPWATDIRFAEDNSGNSYLYLATYGRGIWTAQLNFPGASSVSGG